VPIFSDNGVFMAPEVTFQWLKFKFGTGAIKNMDFTSPDLSMEKEN
jgi:hypothetical protein